ncbi:effector-associated domain 2-containing protein [Amycolatopsis plumensis]|uniref:Effector-associated domain-containing protein n=1 Tax=Amycolatopsis plumensis TaxID=236508 RepID=A0ABV5TWS6_9PSEU
MHSYPAALHRTIMAVDVAGYNDPGRTMLDLNEVHEGLWAVLKGTFAETGIPWDVCYVENTGDGAMILLPPDIAKVDLVAQLPERMQAELRRYNSVRSAGARMHLRLALNAGEVQQASHGSVSKAVSFTFRLLDAHEAKAAQKATGAKLAVILADSFYQEVALQDPAAAPGEYRKISVAVKETTSIAWLRLLAVPASSRTWAGSPFVFSALVDALMAVPCVRNAENRRLLLEMFPRREIADQVPYQAQDRLHVIALARTCQRFPGGLNDLLDVIRILDPDSPQVKSLASLIADWPEPPMR